jgi:hypothetical protein
VTGRRACGHIEGPPTVNGLYVVEIHFGWKLLEWYAGAWWHMAKVGRWMADDPVQWVGPLPERIGGKPKLDFDL